MSILDDYKQLQMIENVKRIKEMKLCYKSNLKLCKQQEKQINKLATVIEKIKEIAKPYNDFSGNCVIVNSFKDMCDILKICDEVNE